MSTADGTTAQPATHTRSPFSVDTTPTGTGTNLSTATASFDETSAPTSVRNALENAASRTNLGAVVGSVFGGVVVVFLGIAFFCFCVLGYRCAKPTDEADLARAGQIGANVGAGLAPVIQPYTEGVGDAPAGQVTYANPAYAHNNLDVDGTPTYDQVEEDEGEEVPYEAPIHGQMAVYDDGAAPGATRQCSQITSDGRCTKIAAPGVDRCTMHVCTKDGCNNSKSSKKKFCPKHAKKQLSVYNGFGAAAALAPEDVHV